MILNKIQIKQINDICVKAGQSILSVYSQTDVGLTLKSDKTPVTIADKRSHEILTAGLMSLFPTIPILSEEMEAITPYETRKEWPSFWCVDPLDGTKEFLKKNDQFCICMAFIQKQSPVIGIIHCPVSGNTYIAQKNEGVLKMDQNKEAVLTSSNSRTTKTRIIGSVSHSSIEFDRYIEQKKKHAQIDLVQIGSALKFIWIAEGNADIYPRFGPTMEWDTAAGQVIVEEMGKNVIDMTTDEPLKYNKKSLVNPHFIVS